MARFGVVVADDDPLSRSLLDEVILSDPSLELVGTATDTNQAIELAALQHPDIAILDVCRAGVVREQLVKSGRALPRPVSWRFPHTRIALPSSRCFRPAP